MVGNVSPGQLIVIALIVLLLFGSRKLRNLGSDLGEAYKGFRKAMHGDSNQESTSSHTSASPLDNKDK